ncbi:hypothetical protein PPS11_30186 [Pseudomonas putida S11]|nr:hypothetical protein PPS11_30186 [Pseudomonas putida S11]
MVDTTAVNCPEITRQPIARVASVQVVLQPDEVERCTDPGDTGDHVNPANAQVQPFVKVCFHSMYLLPVTRSGNALE